MLVVTKLSPGVFHLQAEEIRHALLFVEVVAPTVGVGDVVQLLPELQLDVSPTYAQLRVQVAFSAVAVTSRKVDPIAFDHLGGHLACPAHPIQLLHDPGERPPN